MLVDRSLYQHNVGVGLKGQIQDLTRGDGPHASVCVCVCVCVCVVCGVCGVCAGVSMLWFHYVHVHLCLRNVRCLFDFMCACVCACVFT